MRECGRIPYSCSENQLGGYKAPEKIPPPVSSLWPPISELETKPNQNICMGLCIPLTDSHFHTPRSILTPAYHVRSILIPTLSNTSDPSSLPLSQAHGIHSHSYPHEHIGSILTLTLTSTPNLLDMQHERWVFLIQDQKNGSGNSAAGYTKLSKCGNLPPMDSHNYQSLPRTNILGDNIAGYAGSILSVVTFPKKLTISSNVAANLDSLGDNIAGYPRSILSVVTFPNKLTLSSNVSPSLDSLGDNIASYARSILSVVTFPKKLTISPTFPQV